MKKLLLSTVVLISVCALAEDAIPFTMVKQDASATYAVLVGQKKKLNYGACYYKFTVNNVKENADGSKQITYRGDILNKKKQISGWAGTMGTEGGFFYAINIDSIGNYKMDQDLMFGIAPDMARGGYMFEVPAQLIVGQVLQSSTVRQQYTLMSKNLSSNLTYSDVKVDREEDITVAAGTFHCYVIIGTISGMNSTYDMGNMPFVMHITPGIGIVNYELKASGSVYFFELNELSGL